jgi:hypothetical protein
MRQSVDVGLPIEADIGLGKGKNEQISRFLKKNENFL